MDTFKFSAEVIGENRARIESCIRMRGDGVRARAEKALAQSRPALIPGSRSRFNSVRDFADVGGRSILFLLAIFAMCLLSNRADAEAATNLPGVAVLLVDTDRVTGKIEEAIYGQFLEHINHSDEDGLFAEQIRGRGFEGKDFETYW